MAGYEVDTDALRSHALQLDVIKGNIDDAANAGETTALDGQAFGLLCAFLYPPALLVEESCVAAIRALSSAVAGASSAMGDLADGYDDIDRVLSGKLTKLLAALPEG